MLHPQTLLANGAGKSFTNYNPEISFASIQAITY